MFVPLHVNNGTRTSTRDYVRAVAAACPQNLRLELHALACKVLFDDDKRAIGTEAHLYNRGHRDFYLSFAVQSNCSSAGSELHDIINLQLASFSHTYPLDDTGGEGSHHLPASISQNDMHACSLAHLNSGVEECTAKSEEANSSRGYS